MRVEVYWNLHKGLYSVRALEGENKGRVIARVPSLVMEDVSFVVQPAGRAKVLREQRKNVHAFVRGEWWEDISVVESASDTQSTKVTYNPYVAGYWRGPNDEQVDGATVAVMVTKPNGRPAIKAWELR